MRSGPLRAAFLLWCLFLNTAHGNESVSTPDASASYMLGEAERLLTGDPRDPQLHFTRGMALAELGRDQEAAEEFRWMLSYDPSLLRPRLELARVLLRLGQAAGARYHFEQVLANDLPEAVRQNILNVLARIRERFPTLTLSLDIVSDSNPNQATSADEVEIRGLRYKVNNDGRANKAAGARLALEARLPLAESSLWYLRSNGEIQQFAQRRFNFRYLQVAGGHNIHFYEGTLGLEAGGHAADYGNKPLYDGAVIAMSAYWQWRPDVGAKATLTGQQFRYSDFAYLSGWQYGASIQWAYAPSSATRWETSLGLLENAAREPGYSYLQTIAGARYTREWAGGWISGLGAHATVTRYAGTDPIFLVERHDFERRVEFELSNRHIRVRSFMPRLQLGWTARHSSVDYYRYSRIYARLGLSAEF